MPTSEALLRRELRNYAIEVRKFAYTLPNGVGENDLLQLSQRMSATAEEGDATGLTGETLSNIAAGARMQPAPGQVLVQRPCSDR